MILAMMFSMMFAMLAMLLGAAADEANDFSLLLDYSLGTAWPEETTGPYYAYQYSQLSLKFYHPNSIYAGELIDYSSLSNSDYVASIKAWEMSRFSSYTAANPLLASAMSAAGVTEPGQRSPATSSKSKGDAATFAAPAAAALGVLAVALL